MTGLNFFDHLCAYDFYPSAVTLFAVQAIYAGTEGIFTIDAYLQLTGIIWPLSEPGKVIYKRRFDRVLRYIICMRKRWRQRRQADSQ